MSDGNGDGKNLNPENKQPGGAASPQIDDTVLVVRMNKDGQIQWQSKLPPPQLNWILDIMKETLLKPKESTIVKPGGFIRNLRNFTR